MAGQATRIFLLVAKKKPVEMFRYWHGGGIIKKHWLG